VLASTVGPNIKLKGLNHRCDGGGRTFEATHGFHGSFKSQRISGAAEIGRVKSMASCDSN
jgi:hypothetical protein